MNRLPQTDRKLALMAHDQVKFCSDPRTIFLSGNRPLLDTANSIKVDINNIDKWECGICMSVKNDGNNIVLNKSQHISSLAGLQL